MDPQQRLVARARPGRRWRTRGSLPARIRGEAAGVFVGAIAGDYANLPDRAAPTRSAATPLTGLHRSIIANRVSYTLGLTGPSLTVDAGAVVVAGRRAPRLREPAQGRERRSPSPAASTSTSTRSGRPRRRRGSAGSRRTGAASPSTPGPTATSAARAAASSCSSRWRAALADGDRIYCVIRGSAVNNDGASEGADRPQPGRRRRACCASAYRRAGVERSDVQYVELHGTGTAGRRSRSRPPRSARPWGGSGPATIRCWSARRRPTSATSRARPAIAGLIKAALAIEHRQIPASLNFQRAEPGDPASTSCGLRVQDGHRRLAARRPPAGRRRQLVRHRRHQLPRRARARRPGAGAPGGAVRVAPGGPRGALPGADPTCVLSAKTEPALAAAAERLAAHLERGPRPRPRRRRLLAGDHPHRFRAPGGRSWAATARSCSPRLGALAGGARRPRRRSATGQGARQARLPLHRPGLPAARHGQGASR